MFHASIRVAGIARKQKLVVVSLVRENSRHALARHDPVVHVIAHDVWIEGTNAEGSSFGNLDEQWKVIRRCPHFFRRPTNFARDET